MSRSRKKNPGGTWAKCKSQHAGKKRCSRKFRRVARQREPETMPTRAREVTNPYDLGGDGKGYWPGQTIRK